MSEYEEYVNRSLLPRNESTESDRENNGSDKIDSSGTQQGKGE